MNTTKTTLNGKEIDMRFGMWSSVQLENEGISMTDLQKYLTEKPLGFIVKVAYISACNAAKPAPSLEAYNIADFYDWVDEHGLNSQEVQNVIYLFSSWMTLHAEKTTPAKKKQVK